MSWLTFGRFDNLLRIRRKEYGRDSRLTPAESMTDHLTRPGAATLARRIESDWHARGCPSVKCWIDYMAVKGNAYGDNNAKIYFVRSNLIRGLPPQNGARAS